MANLKQIEKYLQQKRLDFKVVDLEEEAFTVSDVVKSGVDPNGVVKTLIVRTNDGFIALSLCGNDRVDFKKIRARFGSKSELARPEEVLKVVGVPVGAVCPILVGIPLYVDKKVLGLENVHMGSGDLMHGLEMSKDDLFRAIGDFEIENFVI